MSTLGNIADLVAMLSFLGVCIVVLRLPPTHPRVGWSFKIGVTAAASLYLFVSLSNVLEHAALIPALDAYEDYAELLFVPLSAYVLYSRWTTDQLGAARRAELLIRSEHELLTVVMDTTPTGILVVDNAGAIGFANDLARQILGLDGPGEHGEDVPDDIGVRERLDLARIVASAPVNKTLEVLERDGEAVYLSVSATPLSLEGPEPSGAVLALQDVTDRVMTERELEEYRQNLEAAIDRRTVELLEVNRQLLEANSAKQDFLANMSHELRTPLNAIIGFTDLMLRELPGPLTDEQQRQLEMVKASGMHLLDLVNDVLDLARIEGGFSAIERASIDLGVHTCGVVESMGALASVRGVALACDATQPLIADTDPDKLGQIVRNLVSNAVKFTDRGGVVSVTVAREGDDAVLMVRDTGIGIASEDQERIFESFQQIDTPERARPQGTGLGLAIVRDLCELLGYRVGVESAPGRGSTFTVRMPLDR